MPPHARPTQHHRPHLAAPAPAAGRSRAVVPASAALLVLASACAILTASGCSGAKESRARVIAVDDFGDTVRLAGAATRVVSLNPVTTEFLFAIGAGGNLVGRTHWDLYPTAARDVPDVGNGMQPNVEAVLGQTPDLVILYASASNRGAVSQLRAAGVMTLTLRTDHVADLARIAPIVGEAVGRRAAAIATADSVSRSVDAVRTRPRAARPPRVFWHVWDAPVMTIGRGSYLSELLEVVGAENVFGDIEAPSPQVSLEEVVRRDPDVVLAGPAGAATIHAHKGWAAIRAVREGRVLVVDTTLVGRPGVRMGEAARHLRALILGDTAR